MAFQPIPHGIEGVMHMLDTTTGQEIVNVYHWIADPGPSSTQVDDTALYLATTLWTVVRACLPAAVQLVECTARDISITGGYSKTDNTNSGQLGTFGGTKAPGNTALAVSWRTIATGRRNRGRNYYGPMTTNGIINDRAQSGLVAALFQVGAALLGTPPEANMSFAIRSVSDGVMKLVSAFVIDTIADSMRRRLLNRGR